MIVIFISYERNQKRAHFFRFYERNEIAYYNDTANNNSLPAESCFLKN